MGLHGPAPLESIPAAELVHTGTSGPGPCVSAEGVLGPGVGVQLAAVGEIRSCLSPSARCPRSSWWLLWWQRGFMGRWVGLNAGGVWAMPSQMWGARGWCRFPPQPTQHRAIGVSGDEAVAGLPLRG